MSVRPVVLWPDNRLQQSCLAEESHDIRPLAQDLLDTMYAAKGRGLAAPQIGEMTRVFVMDTSWKEGASDPMVFVNPVIMAAERVPVTALEGCLSLPGIEVPVTRHTAVTVQWQSETGEFHMNDFDGFEARCIQHEIDHLNGVVTLNHLSADERLEFEKKYKEAQ